eukprot:8134170-Pyramimonas_sp.AAC.3
MSFSLPIHPRASECASDEPESCPPLQVMPFMLRRTKSQVLKELPPKIIQDVFTELSPMQQWLYHQFEKSQVRKDWDGRKRSDSGDDSVAGRVELIAHA